MEPEERRNSILQAAKRTFAKKGYHATGVAAIIEEAGIARGTFYLYFKSKRDIFTALMEYIIESVKDCFEPIPEDELQIYSTVIRNAELVKEFFFSDPDLAKIFLNEASALDSESIDRWQEVRQTMAEAITKLLKDWQEKGVLQNDLDPRIMSFFFLGAVRELFEQYLITGYLDIDMDQMSKEILLILLFGIVTPQYRKIITDHIEEIETKQESKS